MKIGVRKSPHLELLVQSIVASGDEITSTFDTGAAFYLAWGWPQCQQVMRDNGGRSANIICVDAHPFALAAGDKSGDRIFQLGNWGALAEYPDLRRSFPTPPERSNPDGHVLVLGQVYTAEQKRLGLVDAWHTGGYEKWLSMEMLKPGRVYRRHPRIWAIECPGKVQPTLAHDLEDCAYAVSWNSTAAIHARMRGYRSTAAEAHGWGHMTLEHLAGLRVTQADIRSGAAWARYREWLVSVPPTARTQARDLERRARRGEMSLLSQ